MTGLHDELLRLYERDGALTPEAVLAEAQSPESPLHSEFCWDDTEAARRYRLNQAAGLIRRVKVTVVGGEDKTFRVRAFVNIPGEQGERGSYVPTDAAMADPAMREVAMREAIKAIAAVRRKYQHLIDFDAALEASLKRKEASAATDAPSSTTSAA